MYCNLAYREATFEKNEWLIVFAVPGTHNRQISDSSLVYLFFSRFAQQFIWQSENKHMKINEISLS